MGLDWRLEIYFRLFISSLTYQTVLHVEAMHGTQDSSYNFKFYQLELLICTSEIGQLLRINTVTGGYFRGGKRADLVFKIGM